MNGLQYERAGIDRLWQTAGFHRHRVRNLRVPRFDSLIAQRIQGRFPGEGEAGAEMLGNKTVGMCANRFIATDCYSDEAVLLGLCQPPSAAMIRSAAFGPQVCRS
jgi:hypothetical protein